MTYQVLARKWRPKIFQEVVGQDHITATLKNAIQKEKIAHAYLFTGTRGVGKTTIARIFAKAIRCSNLKENTEPCLVCESCLEIDKTSSLDYIEIDGASNTGVDNIRELIDNVQYLPTTGNKKVYVIDEVHMLSVSAFNALLKTLEEPPSHVVFIFATTDPQKLLGTVLSRCQRFDFKHVDVTTLKSHIKKIADLENIFFENDKVVTDIARFGEGSVRDTLSLLDQVLSLSLDDKISENSLLLSLGLARTESLKKTLEALFLHDKGEVIKVFNSVVRENVDVKKFAKQILDSLFTIIENVEVNGEVINEILNEDVLEKVSVSELLWIYEVLLKDFKWSFENLNPEKMVLFALIKVTLRSEVLGIKGTKLVSKKKTSSLIKDTKDPLESTEEDKVVDVIKVEIPKAKNWDNLLKFAFDNYLAIGSNLEHGNIIEGIKENEEEIKVDIGFAPEDNIFYDYLSSNEIKEKLKDIIKEFYETEKRISLKLTLIQGNKDFKSKAQIKEINDKELKEKKIENIKSNKYIKEAQGIFGQKIEKIILND